MSIAILGALGLLFGFFRDMGDMYKDPKKRVLLIWIILIVLFGSFFYHRVEGWSWIDSFYFSVIALTTVGFGDLSPTTAGSKLFTTVYIIMGLSIFVAFANEVVKTRVQRVSQKKGRADGLESPSPEED